MEKFNSSKLTTTFRDTSPICPIIPRCYTLTHSDITAELFLTIGLQFAFDEVGPMRDEVLAEWWYNTDYGYALYGRVQIDTNLGNKTISAGRYTIFKREMSLALKAISFGDRAFFKYHPILDCAPIFIYFRSVYPEFCDIEYFGVPNQYR